VQEFLLFRIAIRLKSWMMRTRELWVKGFSGREETDRHINILFPVKVFRRKKREKKEMRHLSLSPHAFISYCLILNFHYSQWKSQAKPIHTPLWHRRPPSHTHTLAYIHFNQTPLLIIPIGFFHLPAICCLITKIISRGGGEGPLPWRPNGKGQGEFILSAIENGY